MMTRLSSLKQSHIAQLSVAILMQKNLPDNLESQTFVPGELIPLHSEYLWLLQQGIVKVSAWTQEGNPITLGYWGADDILGKPLALIHPYRVKCLTEVQALYIPLEQTGCVVDLITRHNRQTEELLQILHSDKIYGRLCELLLWLGKKFGRDKEMGRAIDLRLTHQDLAEITGATRVSITKLINQLEEEGFLARPERNSIVLLQR